MNEEFKSLYTPPPPPKKQHTMLKRISIMLLVVLLLATAGYSAYAWKQTADLQASLDKEKSANEALIKQNQNLSQNSEAADTNTATLPGGKLIEYTNNEAKRDVFWWQDESGAMHVSHRKVLSYVAMIPLDVRKQVCGSTDAFVTLNNISMGTFSVDTKEITPNANANCLQSMASEANDDAGSRQEAEGLLQETQSAIETFFKEATIK